MSSNITQNSSPQSYPKLPVTKHDLTRFCAIGIGSGNENRAPGHRIDPPELTTAAEYDRICPTLPRKIALERFKQKYPEKFVNNATDDKTRDIFEKWQKAYNYWLGEYPILLLHKIQNECPQEIQAIRRHLWEAILDENQRAGPDIPWGAQAIIKLHDFLSSKPFKIFMIIVSVIAIALIILFP